MQAESCPCARDHAGQLVLDGQDNPVLEFGSLIIDLTNHVVRKNNEIIRLTATEFSLLSLLTKNHGRVLTHQFLLKEIWGFGYPVAIRREKLRCHLICNNEQDIGFR